MTPNILAFGFSVKKMFPMFFDTAIGFIPVVGTVYDLATIALIASSGTDFWGEKGSNGEAALIAGFLILGSFGRIVKHSKLSIQYFSNMGNTSYLMFPNHKIFSPNPGFSKLFLSLIHSTTDPAFAKAIGNLFDAKTLAKSVDAEVVTVEYAARLEEAARLYYKTGSQEKTLKLIKEIMGLIDGQLKKYQI